MYEIYKTYKIYKIYKCIKHIKCAKDIKRYKTNRRYPSQYGFFNRVRNWQLARDLSFKCDSKNTREPILAV